MSAPVTVYYVAGALLTVWIGDLYERLGPRAVVIGGSLAMAAGLAALGVCAALQAMAAGMILLEPGGLTRARRPGPR